MSSPRRLVFTNRKGGVGKTTTSVNIAAALAHMGNTVLLVDTDPQAHATMSLGISQAELTGDVSDVAQGRVHVSDVIRGSYVPRLQVLPSSRRLSDFERRYANSLEARFWIKKQLEPEIQRHDFTVFDTPPTTQLLTLGSLIAGAEAFVPMQAHFLAMEGMIEIIELVEQTRRHYNP
ncbi:MAG TPA: AAA family ATPase, partial [Alkalispirochaeta sp.]|nr:AAA family ATPase [Alkalispirochaeta sp.]